MSKPIGGVIVILIYLISNAIIWSYYCDAYVLTGDILDEKNVNTVSVSTHINRKVIKTRSAEDTKAELIDRAIALEIKEYGKSDTKKIMDNKEYYTKTYNEFQKHMDKAIDRSLFVALFLLALYIILYEMQDRKTRRK